MPKLPCLPPVHISKSGIPGDWQKNRKYHGGPDRAICLFSLELYAALQQDLIALPPGSLGENLTTQGLDLPSLTPGTRLQIGPTCLLEITKIRTPCRSLDQWDKRLLPWMKGRSGWLCKVLTEGPVSPGDAITLLE